MDLVQEAGIDTTDWSNFSGGAERPASNPRYCYEWAFVREGHAIVLNIWFANLSNMKGAITLQGNHRASAERHSQGTGSSASCHWKKSMPVVRPTITDAVTAPRRRCGKRSSSRWILEGAMPGRSAEEPPAPSPR